MTKRVKDIVDLFGLNWIALPDATSHGVINRMFKTWKLDEITEIIDLPKKILPELAANERVLPRAIVHRCGALGSSRARVYRAVL